MGKHSSYVRQKPPTKAGVHPVWRAIGFLFLLIIPFISYFGALVLLEENARRRWMAIPTELLVKGSDPLLVVKIIMTLVLVFIFSAIFLLLTYLVNSIFGPSRYGPYDVPQRSSYKKRRR